MASGVVPTMAERTSQVSVSEIDGRGPTEVDVGSLPLQMGDGSTLRVASSISSAPYCGFFAVEHVCGYRVEMSSGCDGASRMESCRGGRGRRDGGGGGGGGAGASAKPGLRWVPSAKLDGGRPSRPLCFDGACGPYSNSSRANALLRALLMNGYQPRVAAWGCLLRRVPQVTTVLGRQGVHGLVPYSAPCP